MILTVLCIHGEVVDWLAVHSARHQCTVTSPAVAMDSLLPCLTSMRPLSYVPLSAASRKPVVAASSEKKTLKTIPAYVKAVSGMCGGLVEACSLQPLDVAKTRLQLDNAGKYRGLVHTVRTVATEEGVAALYKGLTPFVTHLTFKYALRFGAFGYLKSLLPKGDSEGGQAAINFMVGPAPVPALCVCCSCSAVTWVVCRRAWEVESRRPSSLSRLLRL